MVHNNYFKTWSKAAMFNKALSDSLLKAEIIKRFKDGKIPVFDVDQMIFAMTKDRKKVFDTAFLQWCVDNGIELLFVTHGNTLQAEADKMARGEDSPLAGFSWKELDFGTRVVTDADGMPLLNEKGMPICLKEIPEGYFLIDNMAPAYWSHAKDLAERVLYREFFAEKINIKEVADE